MEELTKCHIGIWGLLGICVLALMTSLVVNVIYCTANRQKAHRPINHSDKQLQSTVIQVDDNPIYGNLNQENTVEDESCYEAMTPANRYGDETKVVIENQMCYASLDLSMERKKRRRKMEKQKTNNDIPLDDNMPLNTHALTTRPSLYLNSEQLSFNEDRREETSHDDPVIFYGRINTSKSTVSINDTVTAFDNSK
ncbi:T-cell receptor-associated transmembrane adapter 1-like isoform X1 [Scyliorhinus canicula]|uniref:T-cell receptor-associated transmembrane adapter 1-like isoform X1 n=1 Tax=Scyliorhinus canicula TaxID=7830 RepID=UPI0018F6779F|nr:T-cell receptor-associated transmembrane adapter 1-like isoform X1 [Scyliorhinus canicula]